jgi:hypothetical protein
MEIENLQSAIEEAERFVKKAKQLEKTFDAGGRTAGTIYGFPAEQGAVKRASMDLTRSLAKLRNQ